MLPLADNRPYITYFGDYCERLSRHKISSAETAQQKLHKRKLFQICRRFCGVSSSLLRLLRG